MNVNISQLVLVMSFRKPDVDSTFIEHSEALVGSQFIQSQLNVAKIAPMDAYEARK